MDELLLQRVKKGDNNAFAILYDQYSEYALRVAAAVTKSDAFAADAVQETFIRIYNNADMFDTSKPFKPWFYRILINECNRIMKKKNGTIYISDYIENEKELSGEDVHRFEEYEELYSAIGSLEDINRVPLILKYLNGFQEKEIADVLGLNVNTVKSRLFKAREKLKKIMKQFGERRKLNG